MPKYINPVPRFYLHKKKGEYYIFLTLRYNNQLVRMPLSKKVQKRYWDKKRMLCRESIEIQSEAEEINEQIEKYKTAAADVWRETKGKIDAAEFRLKMEYALGLKTESTPKQQNTLTAYFNDYLQRLSKSDSTRAQKTILTRLELFEADRGKAITLHEVNDAFYLDLAAWLYAPPRRYTKSTVAKTIAVTRQMKNRAEGKTVTKFSSGKKSSKVYLTFEELERLYAMHLSGVQEIARDLFLIGAYTGLRISDFTRLKPHHITTDADGDKQITIVAQKVRSEVIIPLLPIPLAILEKWNWAAPKISDQVLNREIKKICRRAGITDKIVIVSDKGNEYKEEEFERWEKIASHTGRRSFATNFTRMGVPIADIMAITDHKTERSFWLYVCTTKEERAAGFKEAVKKRTT